MDQNQTVPGSMTPVVPATTTEPMATMPAASPIPVATPSVMSTPAAAPDMPMPTPTAPVQAAPVETATSAFSTPDVQPLATAPAAASTPAPVATMPEPVSPVSAMPTPVMPTAAAPVAAVEPIATPDIQPVAPVAAPATVPTPATAGALSDIVEVASGAGMFNTLLIALSAAGLTQTLKGAGPFTVFAPTDDAFAKIPKETLDAVIADHAKLTSILTYHVVSGKHLGHDVMAVPSLKTLEGQDLTFKVAGEEFTVDGAKIVATDIQASNGIIHVVDTVLMPK